MATLNIAIKAAESERHSLFEELGKLPVKERMHAELNLKPLIDRMFNEEIARFRAEKRRHSKPT